MSCSSALSRRHEVLKRSLLGAIVLALGLGCPADDTPEPAPPPDASQLPGRYIAQAEGTVTLGGEAVQEEEVGGRLQVAYLVYPDDRVVITHLGAVLEDVDLVVPFLWWEVDREPLRCTRFATQTAAVGTLDGTSIQLPAEELQLSGSSYSARKTPTTCDGELRGVSAANPSPVTLTHDPDGDSFGFSGTFAASHEGNDFTVAIDLEGSYVNRPPIVHIAHGPVGTDDSELTDGCPDPKSVADSERGLSLALLSRSEDPDPHAYAESNLKLLRADLQREDWVRSFEGAFAFLHEGHRVDQVIFAPGHEHVLVLTVTDQSGARARKICEFFVAPPPE